MPVHIEMGDVDNRKDQDTIRILEWIFGILEWILSHRKLLHALFIGGPGLAAKYMEHENTTCVCVCVWAGLLLWIMKCVCKCLK